MVESHLWMGIAACFSIHWSAVMIRSSRQLVGEVSIALWYILSLTSQQATQVSHLHPFHIFLLLNPLCTNLFIFIIILFLFLCTNNFIFSSSSSFSSPPTFSFSSSSSLSFSSSSSSHVFLHFQKLLSQDFKASSSNCPRKLIQEKKLL